MAINPPAPLGAPGYNDALPGAYPAVGLGSLMQGFTQGLQTGNEMLMKQRQNEADMALHRDNMELAHQDRQDRLQELREAAAMRDRELRDSLNARGAWTRSDELGPDGKPIVVERNGYGQMRIVQPKGGAGAGSDNRKEDDDAVLEAIRQAKEQYVGKENPQTGQYEGGLASNGRLSALPGFFHKAIARIDPNSDQSAYHRTVINLGSMLPKRLSGRSNWPEIEAHIKNIPEYGPDKENGAKYFDDLAALVQSGQPGAQQAPAQQQATPAASAGGPIHTYPSGRKVQWNGRAWVPLNG